MGLTIPHIHLLLNHVPTVGTVAGVGLLLLALVRRNDHLLRASFEVLFVVALATLPVYLTGVAAGNAIIELEGVSDDAIRTHETAALLAFVWMMITGFFAWLALWQGRRLPQLPRASVGAVLLLSVVTLALMGRAATIGGEIRHPEILVNPEPAAAAVGAPVGWLQSAVIADFVTQYPWVWPAAEALHFLGLCLVLGVLLAVNLRILGAMRALSFASLHRLLPWGMLGFALNLVTGMLFFIAAATQYTENIAFLWKVIFLGLAGAHLLYLTVFSNTWGLQAEAEAAPLDKLVAAGGIGAWVGVIYWGRMLPFIGNAF
ncbi:MAG: hypothetical protein HYU37_06265 [Acidobacteria bacterium]|nr:hypothetical protein [Acidobacteriota bacterium]